MTKNIQNMSIILEFQQMLQSMKQKLFRFIHLSLTSFHKLKITQIIDCVEDQHC
jgi:hypothetical protein